MNLLYETSNGINAAEILEIHKERKVLFLFLLSLKAYCNALTFDCLAVLKSLLLAP
jgi:hypothetical protein